MTKFCIMVLALVMLAVGAGSAEAASLDYGMEESFVNIHGIITLEYYDFEPLGKNAGISTFDQQAAYLLFDTKIDNQLKGMVELKLDHGGEKLKIDRAFLDYMALKHVSVKAGKFYLPIFYDVKEYRPTFNKLITSPVPEKIDADMFRDLGLEVTFDHRVGKTLFTLEGAVSNGLFRNKYDANTESAIDTSVDTNNDKVKTARLTAYVGSLLELSGSYMQGISRMQIYTQSSTAVYPAGNPLNPEVYTVVNRYVELGDLDTSLRVITATAHHGRWDIRGWYNDGLIKSARTNNGLGESYLKGYMGQASYQVLKNKYIPSLEVVYRKKHFEMDTKKITLAAGKLDDWTADSYGLNAKIKEHLTLKVEGIVAKDSLDATGKDNGIMFQAMIDF